MCVCVCVLYITKIISLPFYKIDMIQIRYKLRWLDNIPKILFSVYIFLVISV